MNYILKISPSLFMLAVGASLIQSCKTNNDLKVKGDVKTTVKVKDSAYQHVGYMKVNTARITDIDKFQFGLSADESKRYLPELFFDIAIVFESAKILPAKSPKLRGETNPDAGDYVLAYKEWDASKNFSPSAASIKRADLYTSDGKQIDDPTQRHNDPGRYSLTMNDELKSDIQVLKIAGRIVLMDIMPDHEDAGWGSFNTEEQARKFAVQVNDAINKYGWDGIDIDEEYAAYSNTYAGSMTRVLYELNKLWKQEDSRHPGKKLIIAKALYADYIDFTTAVNIDGNNVKLADLLTYGWDMSYGGSASYRLSSYLTRFGMQKYQLGLGIDFVNVNSTESGVAIAQYVKDNHLKFVMYYDVKVSDSAKYQAVSNIFYTRKLQVAP